MSKAALEAQLAGLRELRAATALDDAASMDRDTLAARLRPFLKQANNLVVGRAADLARELELPVLLPELVAAFHRFLEDPVKRDPQCWAKNALSKALHHLGCDDSSLYLLGLRLRQEEPVWGGQSDVAGAVRANCAHALVDCRELTQQRLLVHLLEVVADPDPAVRAEAMRAITAAGGDSAILLLRMRALTAPSTEEPPVFGQCYAGLLALEGTAAVPFVAQFLAAHDDLSAEAAVALGETRTPEACAALLHCLHPSAKTSATPEARPRARRRSFSDEAFFEPSFAAVLLSAIALTRQPQAVEALVKLVADESTYAEAAIEALANAAYGDDIRKQLVEIVDGLGNQRISVCYKRNFSG